MKQLWVPLTLLLLIPVPVVLLSHSGVSSAGENGELLVGVNALDSIIDASAGKPVLINFWATWCGPCVRELPELAELEEELAGEAVFVAVDVGDPSLSTLESFRRGNPVGITVVWLEAAEAEAVSSRYGIPDVLPVTIVMDGGGEETVRAVGARSMEWFRSALEGASEGMVTSLEHQVEVHIYVVGSGDDPDALLLLGTSREIAGESVDFLDPSDPADSVLMEEAYLPSGPLPYAQLCVGGACRPPVNTPEELQAAWEEMQGN